MDIQKIRALECPVCFETVAADPMIHAECGNTFDRNCIVEFVKRNGRCPVCQKEVTMEQFKPNVVLRDALREIQDFAVHGGANHLKVAEARELPQPAFGPSIRESDRLFKKEMTWIEREDRNLYHHHLNKKSVHYLRIDRTNRIVSVYKSGNWHFYRIGHGKGDELYKSHHFDEGVRAIFSGRC